MTAGNPPSGFTTDMTAAIPALGLVCAALVAAGSSFSLDKKAPGMHQPKGPKAVAGVLDLRDWDFSRDGPATLAGEWRCLPGALVSDSGHMRFEDWPLREVPGNWPRHDPDFPGGKGAATYELTVLLPQDAPSLGIRGYTGISAFELEIDGRTIRRAGQPSLSEKNAVSGYAPGVCAVGPTDDVFNIIIRTSNYEYRSGGIWRAFELGDLRNLQHSRDLSFYLALSISAMIFALALNYLVIYLFRQKEKCFLLFAIEGLGLSMRPLFTGEYPIITFFPSIPFNLVVRGEYISAVLAVGAGCAFFFYYFKYDNRSIFFRLIFWANLVFFFLCLVLPLYYLTQTIFLFYATTISGFCYVIVGIVIPSLRENRQGSHGLLAGLLILLIGAINYLLSSSAVIHTPDIFPYSLIILVSCQSIVLARHLTAAFKETEQLSFQLVRKNHELKHEIELENASRKQLENALNEEQMLLKEVHHRVKNSLQIVSSIVGLKTMDSSDPAVKQLARTIRNRIRVVSLVHERLYNVGTGDRIELGAYLGEIAGLNIEYAELGAQISSDIDLNGVCADGGFCIDAGLILTELIANAFRHAISDSQKGIIHISAQREAEDLILEIEDNGPGFPEGFNPQKDGGLGFKIINSLLARRGGRIEIIPGGGGRIRCRIPLA